MGRVNKNIDQLLAKQTKGGMTLARAQSQTKPKYKPTSTQEGSPPCGQQKSGSVRGKTQSGVLSLILIVTIIIIIEILYNTKFQFLRRSFKFSSFKS